MQKINATSLIKLIGIVLIVAIITGAGYWWLTTKDSETNKTPINLGLDLQGGLHVVLEAKELPGTPLTKDTMTKAVAILETRVNEKGLTEPIVQAQGSRRVLVQLPGVQEPDEAAKLLVQLAHLEFRDQNENIILTGADLKDARASLDPQNNEPEVNLEFNQTGTQKFAQATSANVGKPIKIYIDGKLQSAPVVQEAITGGKARITMGEKSTMEEAENLAVLLRSGSLPVRFEIQEKRTVGPLLGSDSLNKSLHAGIIGIVMILIFMVGYYRVPGLVADLSLVLYSTIVMLVMALLNATWTLPGIAGFILSIGMAVDANIIIYERIKDELRHGKTLQAAIEAGFDRAFWTIFDANLTTLIAAGVLYIFGTGSIKGFGVTLSVGILCSMFTAITFTRYVLKLVSDLAKEPKYYGV
ncbi:MAG: protein translocase subunit SecD [Solirubrobacterales bacterium]